MAGPQRNAGGSRYLYEPFREMAAKIERAATIGAPVDLAPLERRLCRIERGLILALVLVLVPVAVLTVAAVAAVALH
jgi:hypothetical protein